MSKIGRAFFICSLPKKKSQTSTSYKVPTAIAFELSKTEPPPRLKIPSTCSSFAIFIAFWIVPNIGLLTTPPKAMKSTPFSFKLFITTSKSPSSITLLLP